MPGGFTAKTPDGRPAPAEARPEPIFALAATGGTQLKVAHSR